MRGITGAILAGGKSSRMGEPKPGVLLWDQRPMLAHVIESLQPVCSDMIIVGNGGNITLPPHVRYLPDHRPGLGPLAGLEALLASGLDDRYLVVGCDQPLLEPILLKRFADNTPLSALGFFCDITNASQIRSLEPFPGVFTPSWLGEVTTALTEGRLSIREAIQKTSNPVYYETLDNPKDIRRLCSLNTPQDILQHL